MKKYFLFLVATIGLMMASCSKDDNEIIEPEPTPIPKPDPDPTPTPKPEIIISQALIDSIRLNIFDKQNIVNVKEIGSELISAEEMADKIYGKDGDNGAEELAEVKKTFLKNCQSISDSVANKTGENGVTVFFDSYKFKYITIDEHNNPLTLSAWMCWGVIPNLFGKNIILDQNHIVFVCPYTRTKWDECATISDGGLERKAMLCDNLFIIPDGQGFGVDKDAPQTYLAHHLHAQQYYDCLVAADRLFREQGGTYEDDWDLHVVGASQGGGDALALHKYLETHEVEYDLTAYYNSGNEKDKKIADEICKQEGVSAGTKIINKSLADQWRFAYSYVCAGPYSPETTLKEYLEWGKLSYACVLPMVLKTMLAINPDLAAKYKEEEFYSDIYLQHKEEIDELLLKKTLDTDDLIPYMRKLLAYDNEPDGAPENLPLDRILSQQIMDTSSEMCQDMMAALRKEDLTTGWTPSRKCYMYNCKTDEVVPYKNSVLLMEFLGDLADVTNSSAPDHEGTCEEFYKTKW